MKIFAKFAVNYNRCSTSSIIDTWLGSNLNTLLQVIFEKFHYHKTVEIYCDLSWISQKEVIIYSSENLFWKALKVASANILQGSKVEFGNIRSSRPEVFCKKGVLRNFTGKHLSQSLFISKVAGQNTFLYITPLLGASVGFICFNNEIPLKMMENTFYFILKALSVLETFRFLSWL